MLKFSYVKPLSEEVDVGQQSLELSSRDCTTSDFHTVGETKSVRPGHVWVIKAYPTDSFCKSESVHDIAPFYINHVFLLQKYIFVVYSDLTVTL